MAGETAAIAEVANLATSDGSIPDKLGSMGDPLKTGWGIFGNIMTWSQNKKSREQQAKQFDQTFEENKRQFGLEFALREWAARKNVEINMARQLYEQAYGAAQLNLQTRQVSEGLKSTAQSRLQEQEKFRWLQEDREKAQKVSQAYNQGILSGMFGR